MKKIKIWAGSCMIENKKQALETANFVKDMGCQVYRSKVWGGGTKPPRFWGLGVEGLEIMQEISQKIMPVAIEVQSKEHLIQAKDYKIDYIWIAARAMQNYNLLSSEELSKFNTIVLKRGLGSTLDEWEGAALYLRDKGVKNIIFCERGTVHFDRHPEIRWRPDILSLVQAKERGYEVMFDCSHSVGKSEYVIPMALSAVAAGADYLMVEVHEGESLSDKRQTLNFLQFEELVKKVRNLEKVL
jgi:3-deoxy-7-phosphoheptulonate synthase